MTMMKIQNIHARKILAVLLATATVGCTKESAVLVDTEIENIEISKFDKEQSIEFATFADRSTRATATKSDLEFYHNTFKVYGTKTSNEGTKVQPIFQGVTVTAAISDSEDEPNTWEYTTDRYWDKQADNYQFIAFAPAHAPLGYQHNMKEVNDPSALFFSVDNLTIIGQNLQEGAPSTEEKNTGFTGNEGTDCDVMRSAPFKVTDPATTPVVTLNFRHTLAKLNLTVKANKSEPYVIYVDSVRIAGMLSTGEYMHATGWKVKEDSGKVSYSYTSPTTALSATKKTYFIESLVMPQDIATTQIITLDYTIVSGGYSEEFTYTTTLADVFNGKATNFAGANSYTVNFNIAPETNIITFEAGVTKWVEQEN
jgi:hypothetical protein